ncbi:hypothetical protein ABT158_39230 [Nonomuraea sp. NPDC001636]|uniref:hypothetical protein n=1 Tax=Nonomuraea sp. NPDC001636 TaxID=3154391 RepID=UPI00331C33DB
MLVVDVPKLRVSAWGVELGGGDEGGVADGVGAGKTHLVVDGEIAIILTSSRKTGLLCGSKSVILTSRPL